MDRADLRRTLGEPALSGPASLSVAGAISRPPSMRAIAAFEAAARHENFAKAAEELNLSQSAISHSIRALEEQLGVALFVRKGRYIALTTEGRWLAERLRFTLAQVSEALSALSVAHQGAVLRVDVSSSLAARLVLEAWPAFRVRHPAVRLDLRTVAERDRLAASEADLVIGEGVEAAAACVRRMLDVGPVVALAAPAAATDGLRELPLIEGPARRWDAWRPCETIELACGLPELRLASEELALQFAEAGLGVCLAPERLVADRLAAGTLVVVARGQVAAAEAWCARWRAETAKARWIEALVEPLAATRDLHDGAADVRDAA